MAKKTLDILLVEDSPSDIFLIQESFKTARESSHVHAVPDGVEALAFLRRQTSYSDAPRPDLILMDLNMPRLDGRELLADIKKDEGLKSIPVIVLTSSSAEQDICNAYALHANCYIIKPADYNRFKEVVNAIDNFWFLHVTLPPGS